MRKSKVPYTMFGLACWVAVALGWFSAPSPASARPLVCCFRVSIDVAGSVDETFSKAPNWQPGTGGGVVDAGSYDYQWSGSAYALSEWLPLGGRGGDLLPLASVAYGVLQETSNVHADDNPDPSCTSQTTTASNATDSSGELKKASNPNGLVEVDKGTAALSEFTFGPPEASWGLFLHCGTPGSAQEYLTNIAGDQNWNEQLFASSLIHGLSPGKLDRARSEEVLCTGSARKANIDNGGNTLASVNGAYAYYINIVHFPASEKKSNERRLRGLQNKRVSHNNPAFEGVLGNSHPTHNGCKS